MRHTRQILVLSVACFTGVLFMSIQPMTAKEKAKDNSRSSTKADSPDHSAATKEAYLGLGIAPLHPSLMAHLRDLLEHKQGVVVVQIVPDSPAAKAGFQVHDILMTYGNQKLFSPPQVVALVEADQPGQEVKFGILRDGQARQLTATLGEHDAKATTEAAHASRDAAREAAPATPEKPQAREANWASFDSLSLKSLGDNRYRAEIGYEMPNGQIEHKMFEGTREEIRRDITAQQSLPANERDHLLRALNLRNGALDVPQMYLTRDGRLIWEFPSFNEVF